MFNDTEPPLPDSSKIIETQPPAAEVNSQKSHVKVWSTITLVVLISLCGLGTWVVRSQNKHTLAPPTAKREQAEAESQMTTEAVVGIKLDESKNYGSKYANGILPVGDNKYTTDKPKAGYIFACGQYAQNFTKTQSGAGTRGPWFVNNNTQYDIGKKAKVRGSVAWNSSFTNSAHETTRTIATNGLPTHTTGVFPIAANDPAYAYDRNPNSIKSQSLTFTLNTSPNHGNPECMGGQTGIMLSGVPLFNAFDAGGRDAGAWEVQDSCGGHPEKQGEYHYHTLSSCIKDIGVGTVIGYALDGFPITGPRITVNNILTTDDLDECHGITSPISLDGKPTTTYHYVMTEDFPYSVSCFRSKAIQPPGLQQAGAPIGSPPR